MTTNEIRIAYLSAIILILLATLVVTHADAIDGDEVLEQIKDDERKGKGVC